MSLCVQRELIYCSSCCLSTENTLQSQVQRGKTLLLSLCPTQSSRQERKERPVFTDHEDTPLPIPSRPPLYLSLCECLVSCTLRRKGQRGGGEQGAERKDSMTLALKWPSPQLHENTSLTVPSFLQHVHLQPSPVALRVSPSTSCSV